MYARSQINRRVDHHDLLETASFVPCFQQEVRSRTNYQFYLVRRQQAVVVEHFFTSSNYLTRNLLVLHRVSLLRPRMVLHLWLLRDLLWHVHKPQNRWGTRRIEKNLHENTRQKNEFDHWVPIEYQDHQNVCLGKDFPEVDRRKKKWWTQGVG